MINIISVQQTLRFILDQIRNQADVNIIYDDKLIDDIKVSCKIENESTGNAIDEILKDFDISYKKFDKNTFVLIRKNKSVKETYTATLEQQPVNKNDENVVITEPKQLPGSIAVYPPDAARHNIEGRVGIRLLVDEKGNVTKHVIYKSSGYNVLDSAAVDYTTNLKFIPAMANDKPISIWLSIIVKYQIVGNN